MSTTAAWLQSHNRAKVAYSLVFDGIPLYITGHLGLLASDAFVGTEWEGVGVGGLYTAVKSGEGPSGIGQQLELLANQIKPDSLTFSANDYSGTLRQMFCRERYSSGHTAELTADLSADDTSATVNTTSGFSEGPLYIGLEALHCDDIPDSTTFDVLTRGRYALFGTASDPEHYGRAHILNSGDTSGYATGDAPIVSDWPRVHTNRMVALYMHHFEDGAWSTKANSHLMWAGRIKEIVDHSTGKIDFVCAGVAELLQTTLLENTFTGTLAEGLYLADALCGFGAKIIATAAGGTTTVLENEFADDLTGLGVDTVVTANQLAAWINGRFANLTSGSGYSLALTFANLDPFAGGDAWQLKFEFTGTTAAKIDVKIGLHPTLWRLFGFAVSGDTRRDSNDRAIEMKTLEETPDSPETYQITAGEAPLYAIVPVPSGGLGTGSITINVDNVRGTSVAQDNLPLGAADEDLLLRVGDQVFSAERISNTTYRLIGKVQSSGNRTFLEYAEFPEEYASDPPRIQQVWLERDKTASIWLRALLSTGASGYNDATYDVNPSFMGIALPYDLVDVQSFLDVFGDDYSTLALGAPTPLVDRLDSLLNTYGAALVWRNGQLSIRQVGLEGHSSTAVAALSHSTQAFPDQKPTVTRTMDSVINRVTLELLAGFSDEVVEFTINNLVSQKDFGQIKAVRLKVRGVGRKRDYPDEFDAMVLRVADALSLFNRPRAVIEVSYTFKQETLIYPGDTVTLTDSFVTDPETGTPGITTLACWVMGKSWDPINCVGRAKLVMLPELTADRVALYGPSARVDETQANGGLDAGTSTILTCKAHEYSHSSEAADASHFDVGDKVQVVQLSPTSAASPVVYTGLTVQAQSGNTITVSPALTSPAWDPALYYVVEHSPYASATSTQKSESAFVAASTGIISANGDAYQFGSLPSAVSETRVYTEPYRKVRSMDDDTGEAFSVHKIHDVIENLANLASWRNTVVTEVWQSSEHKTNNDNAVWKLVYGPVLTQFPWGTERGVICQAFMKNSTNGQTANARFTLTSDLPTGSTVNGVTFPGRVRQATCTTTSNSFVHTSEASISSLRGALKPGNPEWCWLCVEIKPTTAMDTVTLAGLSVIEAAL